MKLNPDLALVLGGARCVWTDVARLERLVGPWPGLVIAVNDVGCRWVRRLDHWASLHPDKFHGVRGWRNPNPRGPHGWLALREARGYPGGYDIWSHVAKRGSEKVPPRRVVKTWGGGASGLLGVAVAYALGCRRVALCGIPMDKRPHFEGSVEHKKGESWASYASHRRPWIRKLDRIAERTRSMSGWTREQFGEPDLDWFGEYLRAA